MDLALKSPTMTTSPKFWLLLACVLHFSSGVMSQSNANVNQINIGGSFRLKEKGPHTTKAVTPTQAKKPPLRVYTADMVKAIDTILHEVVPNVPLMTGEKNQALELFLRVVRRTGLLNRNGRKHYVGCASSKPNQRGYPCALWTLLHYILFQNTGGPAETRSSPGGLLMIFRDFIKYFYNCPECVDNYERIVERRPLDLEMPHNEAILWLWKTHNEFNKITADQPGDPQFPKIQFPGADECPSCRNNDSSWQTNEVLKYLKRIYRDDIRINESTWG
ncbi:hypothetical protein KR084_006891 [Drosophila pseudotakahashii]|nr:hypothetical protein KR084_006891 [Drosophila pseudotakahashii]